MPLVSGLSLECRVFENDIGRLEDTYRERMGPILPNGLEEAGEKRRAHDLELQCLGVSDFDRRCSVIFTVEPCKILLVRALHDSG